MLFSTFGVVAIVAQQSEIPRLRGVAITPASGPTSPVTPPGSCMCVEYNDGSTKPSTECGWKLPGACKMVTTRANCTVAPEKMGGISAPIAMFQLNGFCEDSSPPFSPLEKATIKPASPPSAEPSAAPSAAPSLQTAAPPIVFTDQKLPDFIIANQELAKYSFDFQISSIECTNVNIGKLEVRAKKLTEAQTVYPASKKSAQLDLVTTEIGMRCTAKYKYKLDFWPHIPRGGGSIDLVAGGDSSINGQVNVYGLGFGVTEPPKLEMIGGTCKGKLNVVGIHFSGGLSGSILNKFKTEVGGLVESLATGQLCGAVSKVLGKLDTGIFQNELTLLNMMVAGR